MNSQHSVRRFSIGAALLRTTVPKILSWPIVYISVASTLPSSVGSLPAALYLLPVGPHYLTPIWGKGAQYPRSSLLKLVGVLVESQLIDIERLQDQFVHRFSKLQEHLALVGRTEYELEETMLAALPTDLPK